jgi:hypothetical protein
MPGPDSRRNKRRIKNIQRFRMAGRGARLRPGSLFTNKFEMEGIKLAGRLIPNGSTWIRPVREYGLDEQSVTKISQLVARYRAQGCHSVEPDFLNRIIKFTPIVNRRRISPESRP